MKKAVLTGLLCAGLLGLLTGCSGTAGEGTAEETKQLQESGEAVESLPEETESFSEETERELTYRERKEDSWFSEEELRKGGNLAEQYYGDQGKMLICTSFDQEESPFLDRYPEYTSQYGEGNVLILDIQLKGEEGPLALVLVRNSPEAEWEVREERS